jgi:hypothetical protein
MKKQVKKPIKNWQDQLNQVVCDKNGYVAPQDEIMTFGHNIEWDIKDVREYIVKLEKFGAKDIEIPDEDTIRFTLPKKCGNCIQLLLFVMTADRNAANITFKKKTDTLTLSFDW